MTLSDTTFFKVVTINRQLNHDITSKNLDNIILH